MMNVFILHITSVENEIRRLLIKHVRAHLRSGSTHDEWLHWFERFHPDDDG